jgi:hypothetical protein
LASASVLSKQYGIRAKHDYVEDHFKPLFYKYEYGLGWTFKFMDQMFSPQIILYQVQSSVSKWYEYPLKKCVPVKEHPLTIA